MSKTFAAIATACLILASSAASAQMMLKTADTAKGKTLVDAKGMTLYVRQGRRRQVDVQRPLRRQLAGS